MRATDLILRWCDVYTRGLNPAIAGDRRDELASDLWEHAAAEPKASAAILSRAIRGVPADLAWRYEQRRAESLLLPRSTRVIGGSIRALVLIAASSLIALGVVAIARTAAAVASGSARPWSETAVWVIALTGLAVVGTILTLPARTRVFGALVLAASSAVIHFALYDLITKSATIGVLTFRPGWSESIVLLIASYVVVFTSAAILWLPQRSKATS